MEAWHLLVEVPKTGFETELRIKLSQPLEAVFAHALNQEHELLRETPVVVVAKHNHFPSPEASDGPELVTSTSRNRVGVDTVSPQLLRRLDEIQTMSMVLLVWAIVLTIIALHSVLRRHRLVSSAYEKL